MDPLLPAASRDEFAALLKRVKGAAKPIWGY
jgi:hypothetical protein